MNMKNATLAMAIAAIVSVLSMSSCKHIEYVVQKEYLHDTLRSHSIDKDSIVVKDSIIYIQKNDTVKIIEWHSKNRIILKTDTFERKIAVVDSIPYPVEVEMKLGAYDRIALESGRFLLPLFLILLAILVTYAVVKSKALFFLKK